MERVWLERVPTLSPWLAVSSFNAIRMQGGVRWSKRACTCFTGLVP